MSPELQSAITTAELTLIPLAVGALAAWFKYVTDKLKTKDAQQQTAIDRNTYVGAVHAEVIDEITGHPALSSPPLNIPPAVTPTAQPPVNPKP